MINKFDLVFGDFLKTVKLEAGQGMSSFPKIFVYGNLMRGFRNHQYLAGAKFLGTGRTVEKCGMYTDGSIPFVVQDEEVSFIYGELYVLDIFCLRNLDRLEGHPRWYKREEIEICLNKDTNTPVVAWMYFMPHKIGRLIPSGKFTNTF